jgi:hypothetical protein
MRHYKVNKIDHTVFESKDEVPQGISYRKDWRNAEVGDWVEADDGCIIQILRKGGMLRPKGKVKQMAYLGTCTGTFPVRENMKMDTSRRKNIYAFGGDMSLEDRMENRTELTSAEGLFVAYLSSGMSAQQSYIKAFPTNSPGYANLKAMQLIKTKRVRTAMKEELKPVLAELKIDESYVLKGIKHEADQADKADVRLKALFKLSDILDMEDKNTTNTQQITGAVFQGFSDDQLQVAERPIKQIGEGNE